MSGVFAVAEVGFGVGVDVHARLVGVMFSDGRSPKRQEVEQTSEPMPYILTGFDSEAGDAKLVWESDDIHQDLEQAVAAARSWVAVHPTCRVDIANSRGSGAQVVRVVTAGGVERVQQSHTRHLRRVSTVDAWMMRPLNRILVGVAFVAGSIWMVVDPARFDRPSYDPPDALMRALGVLGIGLFGFVTIITVIEMVTDRAVIRRRPR